MAAPAPIYAIVLALFTGPPAPGTDWKKDIITIYETPPVTTTSQGCQEWAAEFNKYKGDKFTGHQFPFKGVKGVIVGAWCFVPVKVPPTKEKK